MATGLMGRLAGKALSDFLKAGLAATGQIAERGALNVMRGARTPGAILSTTLQGPLPANAETLASVARVAAPVAVTGGALGLGALAQKMAERPQNVYAQSAYSLPVQRMGTPVAFSNQQYMPGMSPMTNQTVAEAMLEQQKFQHQLQLIEARQAAATRQGSLSTGVAGDVSDVLTLATKIYG
jgi:hypothetical protein